jgi:hypothetical protein
MIDEGDLGGRYGGAIPDGVIPSGVERAASLVVAFNGLLQLLLPIEFIVPRRVSSTMLPSERLVNSITRGCSWWVISAKGVKNVPITGQGRCGFIFCHSQRSKVGDGRYKVEIFRPCFERFGSSPTNWGAPFYVNIQV